MISGRSTSIPNWSTMYAASSGESAMFFGISGSIAGGQIATSGRPSADGTYSGMWKMAASYSRRAGSRKLMTSGLGVEKSMCPRQTHFARRVGKDAISEAGCGSCTTTKSYSSAGSSSAFASLWRR